MKFKSKLFVLFLSLLLPAAVLMMPSPRPVSAQKDSRPN